MEITNASDWRENSDGVILKLPTNRVVKIQRVKIEKLLIEGKVPDGLSGFVASVVAGQTITFNSEKALEWATLLVEYNKLLCTAILVEPKLSDNPDVSKNEISFFDLEDDEVSAIIEWGQKPMRELEKFREKQEVNAKPTQNRKNLRNKTKQTS